MPRHIVSPGPPSPRHDRLVKKLLPEFAAASTSRQPLILEERVPETHSRHVHVIWDAWKDLPDEQRSAIIVDAYRQAEGDEAAAEVTIAEGVTAHEALALGLLPFKVVPARKRNDPTSPEDYRQAMEAEGRHTLLGPRAKELRYARLEDAEQAHGRLKQALPGSSWTVIQELFSES
jgi:hypothetical protein